MKIKIGTVIENHLIYAIYGTEHCLARPILPDGEFVVWHIDEDGKGVWGGSYFPNQMDAERAYVARCFPWLSDNVLFAANEEDDETGEFDMNKEAIAQLEDLKKDRESFSKSDESGGVFEQDIKALDVAIKALKSNEN